MKNKKKLFTLLALSLIIFLVSCNGDDNTDKVKPVGEGNSVEDNRVEDDNTNKQPAVEGEKGHILAADFIYDKFLDHYKAESSDIKISKMKYKAKKNIYELEGFDNKSKEYELYIDGESGEILKDKVESSDDREMEILKSDLDIIPSLIEKTLEDAPNAYDLKQWSIEYDDGVREVEIEVYNKSGDDLEYKYNAENGALIKLDD